MGMSFRSFNLFDILLLAAILSFAVISFVSKGNYSDVNAWISAIAAILGVFCVVLGAKGSISNWIFGTVEAFLHIYICFCTHIYGDFLQRLIYNLPMQFIGWKQWSKRERKDNTATIHTRYMTWGQRGLTLGVVALGTVLLSLFLMYFGPWLIDQMLSIWPDMQFKTLKADYANPTQLWLDSFTTVMAVVTMFISVKAFVEQWYMWLIINVAYIWMWSMSDSPFTFMTVAKYCVYFINSIYGIIVWHRLSKD